jgi:hypothetical protein
MSDLAAFTHKERASTLLTGQEPEMTPHTFWMLRRRISSLHLPGIEPRTSRPHPVLRGNTDTSVPRNKTQFLRTYEIKTWSSYLLPELRRHV